MFIMVMIINNYTNISHFNYFIAVIILLLMDYTALLSRIMLTFIKIKILHNRLLLVVHRKCLYYIQKTIQTSFNHFGNSCNGQLIF